MVKKTTHFGYEEIPIKQKTKRVKNVFDSVAHRYDIMNDLMSGGLHRLWKKFTVNQASVKRNQAVLDLAGGTGDLTQIFCDQVGNNGHVILADINFSMLNQGRARLINKGAAGNLSIVQVDAETPPFSNNSFDCITIAFGLRNITNKEIALSSMYRILKPGGKLLILEFSTPLEAIQPIYDIYSFKILPLLGEIVAKDADSYRYLAESIRMHPDQETLLNMMQDSKFEQCRYHNLSAGIVALHIGYKF